MAFSPATDDDGELMSEINMIPLIDVMLVLLIVFLITIPVMQHAVPVELPRAASAPQAPLPQAIRLAVDAEGRYLWNETPLSDAELAARLAEVAAQEPQPAVQLHGDRAVRYERVAQVLAAAQRAGVRSIGFVTEQP
ncbi:MAG: biopolymer transporter ExbD [Pseudomonadota bacterium]